MSVGMKTVLPPLLLPPLWENWHSKHEMLMLRQGYAVLELGTVLNTLEARGALSDCHKTLQ